MSPNLCRLCLGNANEGPRHKKVTELHRQVEEIFKFKIPDRQELPQNICPPCCQVIAEFYTYYENVLDNQTKLEKMCSEPLEMAAVNIKEEGEVDDTKQKITMHNVMLTDGEVSDLEEVGSETSYKGQYEDDEDDDGDEDEQFVEAWESPEWKEPKRRGRKKKVESRKKKPASSTKTISQKELEKQKEEDEKIAKYFSFKCIMCPSEPITCLREWLGHQRKVHKEKNPAIVCCDRKLRSRVRILSHIHYHHELEPLFECTKCAKKFKRQAHLDGHMRSHGIQKTEKFQCDKCPERFTYQSHLEKHRIIHLTPEEQKLVQLFGCDLCEKTFARQHQVLTHKRRIHQRRYTFICHICAKKFNKKERLEAHMLDKHTDNPPKHQCEVCGVEVPTHEAYRRHLRFYHAEQGEFTCDICGVTRKNEMSLKQHKRYVHETERKYACEYCPKAFRRALELTEHLTTHLGGTLYTCPHCDRKFNSKANMQSRSKHKCTILFKDLVNAATAPIVPNPVDPTLADSEVLFKYNLQ